MTQSLSPPQETADTAALPKPKRKPSPRILIPLGLLLTGAGVATWYFLSAPSQTEPLRVSGRIEGYETDIGAKVAGRVDGTDGNNARVIQNSIKATTNFFVRSAGLKSGSEKVVAHMRFWFNPGRKESLFIVPGVYAIALSIFPAILAAIAMVREKEQGTILQIYTSTLSPTELLLGKALAYLLIFLGLAFCWRRFPKTSSKCFSCRFS
jgi:hypothetical protein